MAIREFRGDFHLSEQRGLSVGFGSESAGGSFRRSETRLSGGLTPFHQPEHWLYVHVKNSGEFFSGNRRRLRELFQRRGQWSLSFWHKREMAGVR
jgi:hypothetical protein